MEFPCQRNAVLEMKLKNGKNSAKRKSRSILLPPETARE
jgi:hypothetical protein